MILRTLMALKCEFYTYHTTYHRESLVVYPLTLYSTDSYPFEHFNFSIMFQRQNIRHMS